MAGSFSDASFLDVLEDAFRRFSGKPFLTFDEKRYTYSEIDSWSLSLARALRLRGFRAGAHGAVYGSNSIESVVATIGIIRAGGVWVPINPRNSEKSNSEIMRVLGCDAVFAEGQFLSVAGEFGAQIVVALGDWVGAVPTMAELSGEDAEPLVDVARSGSDVLMLPTTGGTTGAPKGVMLSHRNFCAIDYGMRLRYVGRKPVVLGAAPMTHVGGRIALASMSAGAEIVILDRIEPAVVLDAIESHKVTDMFLPPTALYSLLEHPALHDYDLSSLQAVSYGSAPMSISKLRRALEVFGPVMEGGYGQTECPMFISRLTQAEHIEEDGKIASDDRLRSVGRSTPLSEVAIVDDDGHVLAPEQRGEIAVKGPMVSEGYFRDEEETRKIRRNGWHLTGDIGYLSAEGYLYIVDRKKDMIISGGFNVYSAEVEQALMAQPGVACAVVVGVPNERWGEEVRALVQLEQGASVDSDDLIRACKVELGSVKAPKSIVLVKEFPKTPVGKVDKKAVKRKQIEDMEANLVSNL